MASIVQGNMATAQGLLYGDAQQISQDWLDHFNTGAIQQMSADSRRFFQERKDELAAFTHGGGARLAKAAVRKLHGIWGADEFRPLNTIGELQHAPQVMRPYLMAEPTVRAIWQKDMCDGWGDVAETRRNYSGENLVEWRRVMNGHLVAEGDTDYYVNYYNSEDEDLLPEEELTIDDQVSIRESWYAMVRFVAAGKEDPTSPFNDLLPN
ncbi:hypothetical protein [Endozoicomonas sp. ONNA1]|uniref:hypothetical protein n=1 Tax=Endozoicomonas sp. ONNA1 TaxID=2828740 RepID=UPI0021492254|nr:hypothetical protein [Endozoicomonas sp. ONNA1]